MDKRIKETFDEIHAEEGLKNKTKAFLSEKTHEYQANRRRAYTYKHFIPVVVCFFFLVIGFGGYRLYFTEASVISIDINPSFELGVNRFDRVISVKGFNKDGDKLVDSLNVRFLNYAEALTQILDNTVIKEYLSRDELLSIAVIGSDETQNEQMLSHIESCTAGHENTHCSSADSEDVEGAHEHGLSCGKYKAFLELKALNPDITVDEVRKMTMREIRDLIDSLSPDSSSVEERKGNGEDGLKRKENNHGHTGPKRGHNNGHN